MKKVSQKNEDLTAVAHVVAALAKKINNHRHVGFLSEFLKKTKINKVHTYILKRPQNFAKSPPYF